MPGIVIRPAQEADISFIREQYREVETNGAPAWREEGQSPYSDSWIEEVICRNPADQAILVAVDEQSTLLGYTWVLVLHDFDAVHPHGHVAGVGVAEDARGRGIGSQLVGAAESWLRAHGLNEVTLHCYVGNQHAHRLYQRLGFQDEWFHMRKALD